MTAAAAPVDDRSAITDAIRQVTDLLDAHPTLAKALSHPGRVRILAHYLDAGDGRLSPNELARRLPDQTLGTIAYHVRTLHRLGLLADAGTEPRRGATEHYYRLAD